MWLPLALACARSSPFPFSATLQEAIDPDANPAVRELTVSTGPVTTLRVELDDGDRTRTAVWDEATTVRTVPILGLTPGRTTTVTASVEDDEGETASEQWEVEVPSLPADFPQVDVLALDADRTEPGWTLAVVNEPETPVHWVLLLDERGQVVWWWDPPYAFGDLRLGADGHLWGLAGGQAVEVDWLGRTYRRWSDVSGGGGWVFTPIDEINHEMFVLPDGFLTLDHRRTHVDEYPVSDLLPEQFEPADIDADVVLDIAFDGTIRSQRQLADVLDTQRIGFDSLDHTAWGLDWVHANAVVPDPTGGTVVCVRHQDAVVKLDSAGDLDWILGTPAGWRAPWSDSLLTPVGTPFSWPYHPHGAKLEPDGTVVMFDNEFHGYNPYEPPVSEPPSRAVGYRVDEEARTVRQVFSFDLTATGTLHSHALGDADWLPQTGDILADYGFLDGESGLDNADLGWGRKSIRFVEWTPDGDLVGDFRLHSDIDVNAEGWVAFRVERIATPWPTIGPAAGNWEE